MISTFRGARDDRRVHFFSSASDEQHEGLRSTGERVWGARTTGVVIIITEKGPDARSIICGRSVDHDHDAHQAVINVNKHRGSFVGWPSYPIAMPLEWCMEDIILHAPFQRHRDRIRWRSSRADAAARPSGIIVRKIGSFHRYAG